MKVTQLKMKSQFSNNMKTYNYFYYGQAIPKSQFVANVPESWENDVVNGEFSFGGYRAIERD